MNILGFFPKFTLVESRINWGPVVAPLSLCWQNCIIFLLFYLQVSLITKIRKRIADGHRVLIHCYGGLGRAVLVAACLVMTIDEDVFTDEVQFINYEIVIFFFISGITCHDIQQLSINLPEFTQFLQLMNWLNNSSKFV